MDDRPLPGAEGPAAGPQGPDLQPRELDGRDATRAAAAARCSCAAAGSASQDSVFDRNRCDRTGPDLGGAAIRVLSVTAPVKVIGQHLHPGQVLQRRGAQQHRRLVEDPRQRLPQEQGDRHGGQPGPAGHPGRRQRWSDLPRRQLLHAAADRRADGGQQGPRGRRRHLLRLQRPHRDADDLRLDPAPTTRASASRPTPASSSSARRRPSSTAPSLLSGMPPSLGGGCDQVTSPALSVLDLVPVRSDQTSADAVAATLALAQGGRRARLPPLLAGRAPQHAGRRGDEPAGADRPGGRCDPAAAGRVGRRDAAQPRAAGGRRAVRAARGGVPRPDRPRHRPRPGHRPGDELRAAARRRGSDRRGGQPLPGVRRQHPGDDGAVRGRAERGRSDAHPAGDAGRDLGARRSGCWAPPTTRRGSPPRRACPTSSRTTSPGSGTAEALELYRSTFRPVARAGRAADVPHRQRGRGADAPRRPSAGRCPTC